MKIFLADDHPLLRIGLRITLEQEDDMQVVGEASDGYTAVTRIQMYSPDLSLIDYDLPGISGDKVVRLLRNAGLLTKLLILSCYHDENYIREAMEAGADGYILKCIEVNELIRIMRNLYSGQTTMSPYMVNLSLPPKEDKVNVNQDLNLLTMREREILKYIAEGKINKEISTSLNISLETVKTHARNIYSKLNVKGRVEAVKIALDQNYMN
jgi:DNA-binding NarL/FixJ family response regulator